LPAAAASPPLAAALSFSAESPPAPAPADPGKTVLVVDDHPQIRKMFTGYLRELGYAVLEADGPGEARDFVVNAARIDLLLTDFYMPEMNGLQLTRWFRLRFPAAKVLIVSTSPEDVRPLLPEATDIVVLDKAHAFARLAGIAGDLLNQPSAPHRPLSNPALPAGSGRAPPVLGDSRNSPRPPHPAPSRR
jgi:CheY-like chemotaxis protein